MWLVVCAPIDYARMPLCSARHGNSRCSRPRLLSTLYSPSCYQRRPSYLPIMPRTKKHPKKSPSTATATATTTTTGTNSTSTYTDVILPMQDPYMAQIIAGTKNHEFRKYRLKPSVQRIWFYRTAPHSSITHISEILPARTRPRSVVAGDTDTDTDPHPPLNEDGLGNAEFNNRHKDWEGWDFAYQLISVYELWRPISLRELREVHGFRSAPRGLVYTPRSIVGSVDWKGQKLVRIF